MVTGGGAGVSPVWRIVRRRWRLLVLLAVAGALVGVALSWAFSPGYVASARVLLQGQREPDELTTEAELAHSSQVLDRVAGTLSWDASASELADEVTASVAEGNIIEISAEADTAAHAGELADGAASEYVAFSTQLRNDTSDSAAQVVDEQRSSLRQQVLETNRRIAELHASAGDGDTIDSVGVRTELESLRNALSQAVAKLDELEESPTSEATAVMGPAERPDGRAAPTLLHFAGGGALTFVLAGVFGHLVAARADRRPLDERRVAVALGTSSLGELAVPAGPARTEPGPWRRLRGWFVGDGPWYLPEPSFVDGDEVDVRCRRVLARLRATLGEPAARVVVVAREGDGPARAAASRLASVASEDDGGTGVRELVVRARRPVVSSEAAGGVLVVVGAATRNAWELVDLAGACADAGLPLLGVVMAHPALPSPAPAANVPERPAVATGEPA